MLLLHQVTLLNTHYTELRTKFHTIDCASNTRLLLQNHFLASKGGQKM